MLHNFVVLCYFSLFFCQTRNRNLALRVFKFEELAAIAKLRGTGVGERRVAVCEKSTRLKCLRLQDVMHTYEIVDVPVVPVSSFVRFG